MYKLPSSDIITTVTVMDSLWTLKPFIASGLTNEAVGVLLTSTLLPKIVVNNHTRQMFTASWGEPEHNLQQLNSIYKS